MITIGGTDGVGIHTMVATIITIHTITCGIMATTIGMDTIGMQITGTTIIIPSPDIQTVTYRQMACFQQQEAEPLHATGMQLVQTMVATIHETSRTDVRQ